MSGEPTGETPTSRRRRHRTHHKSAANPQGVQEATNAEKQVVGDYCSEEQQVAQQFNEEAAEEAPRVRSGKKRRRVEEIAFDQNDQGESCDATADEPQHDRSAPQRRSDVTFAPRTLKVPDRIPPAKVSQLSLNPLILQSITDEFKFETLMPIQTLCLAPALGGNDILAEAKTGSGKTLAFLLPIVEILCRSGFRPESGTGALIIGPTRELCKQIEGVLLRLLKFFNGRITFLCCIGGMNRKTEGFKLASGQQIVVSTPGRLLDHLKLTSEWHTRNLLLLCVDEADRVLDNGFEDDIREIVSILPRSRQTFLFSATQTTRVEQLARVSFRKQPIFISMKTKEDTATVETLEQGYVTCPSELRLLLLYHFIRKNAHKKIIVFFSSRNSVSFHCELFNYIDAPCVAFHGKQKQHQRTATYMQFCNASSGVLLTTDVASRGLDIPQVDWIVQFDPPDDPTKYIHRVGRTARAGLVGSALMFLLPSETMFLKYLYVDARINVNEYAFDEKKMNLDLQKQLEKLVGSNYYMRQSAKLAYEGYLLAYSSNQLKNVFDVQQLDLARVARGFGLSEPPPIRIDLSQSAAHLNKRYRAEFKKRQINRSSTQQQQRTQR